MKSNLGALAPSLTYRLAVEHIKADVLDRFYLSIGAGERAKLLAQKFPRVQWELVSTHTDRSLLQAELALERPTKRNEARDFLQKFLAGGQRLKSEIRAAWERTGGKWGTLDRASTDLGVKKTQDSNDSRWSLPLSPEDEI
jgi:hypothetical protein